LLQREPPPAPTAVRLRAVNPVKYLFTNQRQLAA
jgi:hypothetical protein